MKKKYRYSPGGFLYYRHSLPVRLAHWINAVLLFILFMSGLNIFNAHPALYWGKSSYRGAPPILEMRAEENASGGISGKTTILGRTFDTTGFLGLSRDPQGELSARGFPSWLTVPDNRWLAMARRWHFFCAWLLVMNGVIFVIYSIGRGHLRQELIPAKRDWRSIGRSLLDHLRLRHATGEAARNYNILQKLAYLGVIFFLIPLAIGMGLGMSPALDALASGWVDIFFGRASIRTIHFVVAWALVIFLIVHVFEVIISGLWNNIRSMLTGYYKITSERKHG